MDNDKKDALAEIICEEFGKKYAEKLYEKWKEQQPAEKRKREAKKRLQDAAQEMYFNNGVFEDADRTLISPRVAEVLGDVEDGRFGNVTTSNNLDVDVRLEYDKMHKPKSEIRTFGDLVNMELEPLDSSEIIVVERTFPKHIFSEL